MPFCLCNAALPTLHSIPKPWNRILHRSWCENRSAITGSRRNPACNFAYEGTTTAPPWPGSPPTSSPHLPWLPIHHRRPRSARRPRSPSTSPSCRLRQAAGGLSVTVEHRRGSPLLAKPRFLPDRRRWWSYWRSWEGSVTVALAREIRARNPKILSN